MEDFDNDSNESDIISKAIEINNKRKVVEVNLAVDEDDEDALDLDDELTNEDGAALNKKKRRKVDWEYQRTFASFTEAHNSIKDEWSQFKIGTSSNEKKYYYRCNHYYN